MEFRGIFNKNEGETVDYFIWPFNRFRAVIPNQIGGDIFVWLYLSLIVFANEAKKLPLNNYNEDVKIEAKKLITEKFSNIIDSQTLDKIISNAENDFISLDKIKSETFSFLNTYENLFADSCETRMVYQDAVTGEVLPFFGDSSNIEDYKGAEEGKIVERQKIKEPSSSTIKKAYIQYSRMKKFNGLSEMPEVELENEFLDEDAQTFLDNQIEETTFSLKKEERNIQINKKDVIIDKSTEVQLNIKIWVYIKDNKIAIESPFGKMTNGWFEKCMHKGRNVSESMEKIINKFEMKYCVDEEKNIQSLIESYGNDFASNLKYCQILFRLLDSLNDDKLREYVVKLDNNFSSRDEEGCFYIGKILENIVKKIQSSSKTSSSKRAETKFDLFCVGLDNKCQHTKVNYQFLKNPAIFSDWKRKYTSKDGKEYNAFKADLTDIILTTNIINSPNMYDSFIEDIFDLYSKRNFVSHDNSNKEIEQINYQQLIDKLIKVLKVLFELI